MLFLSQENKIHIFKTTCNILYMKLLLIFIYSLNSLSKNKPDKFAFLGVDILPN